MLAIARARTDVCQLLLEEGADPRLRDNIGRTALDYVPQTGSAELIDVVQALSAESLPLAEVKEPDPPLADDTTLTVSASGTSGSATSHQTSAPPRQYGDDRIEVVDTDDTEPLGGAGLWEAEVIAETPADDLNVKSAAVAVQADIGRHKAISTDEDWTDIELDLPEVAPRRLREVLAG